MHLDHVYRLHVRIDRLNNEMSYGDSVTAIFSHPHSTDLEAVPSTEVDWYERQPDDARRIHGESDELGFVEVLRHLPGLDGVIRTHRYEQHVVQLRDQERGIVHVAL